MAKRSTRFRGRFICLDCHEDTGKMREFYYLQLELWLSVVGSKDGMLCIGCIESRLGRRLNGTDFTSASINNPARGEKSARLLDRLRSLPA